MKPLYLTEPIVFDLQTACSGTGGSSTKGDQVPRGLLTSKKDLIVYKAVFPE